VGHKASGDVPETGYKDTRADVTSSEFYAIELSITENKSNSKQKCPTNFQVGYYFA